MVHPDLQSVFRQQLKLKLSRGLLVSAELVERGGKALVGLLQALAVFTVLPHQRRFFEGAVDGVYQKLRVYHRLRDEVPGTPAKRLDDVLHRANAGHDDHGRVREVPDERAQDIQAVEPRHPQIQ